MQTQQNLTGYPSIDKPWLKYYSEEAINSKVPECTMYEYVLNNNKDHCDDIALVYFGKKITYKELLAAIDQTAAAFSHLGIKRGDVVTIQSLSIPQVVYTIYALSKIGAVANLIYANANADAVTASMAETDSHVLVVMEPIFNAIQDKLSNANLNAIIVMRIQDEMDFVTKTIYSIATKAKTVKSEGYFLAWNAFYTTGAGKSVDVQGQSTDPVIMVYTGGTTGKPKAVVLSNQNINAGALQYVHLGFERQKTMLCALPPFIAFGITVTLHTPLAFGLKTALCVGADPAEIGGFVQKYKPNYVICGTVQAERIMETIQNKKFDLSFLRCLSLGGDVLPENLEERLNEFLIAHNAKIRIAQGYAMSETSAAAAGSTRTIGTTVYKKGTIGVPLVHTNIKIVDPDTGNTMKYGQNGEICIHSPCMMMGYYNNREETDNILKVHDDGLLWVHTGDIGNVDEDGFITIVGRIKRMILTLEGGICHKVFPVLLEADLLKCSCVKEISIVGRGRKDNPLVHDLIAFAVLENGLSEESARTAMSSFAEKNFESYERPCKYIFVDKLPRTTIGKIDYRTLEQEAQKEV